ncbi:MAG TPA: peptidase S9 family protein [Bacteroidales bacterium]|nr:peptidase S9 family protein [Bacteroidales bacterium]
MKKLLFIILSTISVFTLAQNHLPTFEEVISLRNVGSVQISPDGKDIVFTVSSTDWGDNRYDTEVWLSHNGDKPFRLTNTSKNSSSSPQFSPDGKWISFVSDRGNKNQIYVIRTDGGEAMAVTNEEDGVSYYEWHPDGKRIIFIKTEKESNAKKEREKRYGAFETDDREYRLSHLWKIDFNPEMPDPAEFPCYETVDSLKEKAGCIVLPKAQRLTEGNFTVARFLVSPDGNMIAFTHRPDPLINSGFKTDISILDLSSREVKKVVSFPSGDNLQDWSPDSKEILFMTSLNDTLSNYYKNQKLLVINCETGQTRELAKDQDISFGGFTWELTGIYSPCYVRTNVPLYRIDPDDGSMNTARNLPEHVYNVSFARDGRTFAFSGRNGDQLTEIYVSVIGGTPRVITGMNNQITGWKTALSEVITWKSKDGTLIEGVLHKPKDYVSSKKYPLLVIIHGGPTGIDSPTPVPGSGVYPVLQWLDKGCLVLRPNYRGSDGYGEAFRSLNVRNLGVGDMWDVMSGVEYLDKKGIIDKNFMGCMGWSQGGYISAFLTTNTNVFKAISVGAGISDWMTYYVNTDIHPFTIQYLKATPWEDGSIYKLTSPVTNINKARTPTLIQHGEFDRRVPIANAYELLQGLRDRKVPVELIVYKGFGHGISKPKERLAATWHNWQWFNKYIWGEEVELPLGEQK